MNDHNHTVVMDSRVFVQFPGRDGRGWMGIGPVSAVADALDLPDSIAEQKIGKIGFSNTQARWLRGTIFGRADDESGFQSRIAGFAGAASYDLDHGTSGTHYQSGRDDIPQRAFEADSTLIHDETTLSRQQSAVVALLLMGYSRKEIAAWLNIDAKNVDSQRSKMRDKLVQADATEGLLADVLSRGARTDDN